MFTSKKQSLKSASDRWKCPNYYGNPYDEKLNSLWSNA